jgi:membrane protease YdiL (CAAX protease family)
MGLIFLISRSLLLLILLHFVIDVLGGLAGMYLIPATAVDESESETYQSE